jgi:uncharacterized protein (DUF486 family)
MTTAWYGHLHYKDVVLWQPILISWGLAFIEYCLAVPANRYGSSVYSPAQLKTIQEVVTPTVFAVFSMVYLQQTVTWNQIVGFALVAGGALRFPCALIRTCTHKRSGSTVRHLHRRPAATSPSIALPDPLC